MQCGTRIVSAPERGPAERRQITVLFCDLVGSTPLSEELDPEDLRDVIRAYHSACEAVVTKYDGAIAQLLGDGVLVYFGHPRAHEDDALRAVRAGLELGRVVADLRVRRRPLAVRVGIHTGVVVVGSLGAEGRQLALGATPNLASRVQQEAQPGEIVITEVTHRLVAGFFEEIDLGSRSLRGISQPVRLFRVESETGARSRMEATAEAALTPFVGREKELTLVRERWGDALAQRARALALCGEAGIGKSRIVRKLRESVGPETLVIECYASPLFQGTALHPVVETLDRLIGAPTQAPDSRRARLREELDRSGLGATGTFSALEALLSIPPLEPEKTANLSPQKQREATFDALAAWLHAAAERQPVLFVFEDLHWADPSTIELAGLLIERLSHSRLMILLTYRPDFTPPFASSRLEQILLHRMQDDDAEQLLAAVTKERRLPHAIQREVLAKADGVPLYVEEIAKAVLESGESRSGTDDAPHSSRSAFSIPSSVADSFTARLDRLGEGKRILQLAATLGRTFALGMLLDASGLQEATVRADLGRLLEAGLVLPLEAPEESYIFKHALIQDAAYGSLLRGPRQEYHRQIAAVLQAKFPTLAAAQPELFARHFEGADMVPQAIAHWVLAGQGALARSANAEAISAFGNALRLLSRMAPSEARDRQEIDFRCGLGLALISARGFSSPEVEQTYVRASELCAALGTELPLRVLYGTWVVNIIRGDLVSTKRMVPNVEHLAQERTGAAQGLVANAMLGAWLFFRADYADAIARNLAATKHLDRNRPKEQHFSMLSEHGFDGILYSFCYLAWCQSITGQVDAALATLQDAAELSQRIGDPYVRVGVLALGAAVHHDLGDFARSAEMANTALELCVERAFVHWQALALAIGGSCKLASGKLDDAIATVSTGLEIFRAVGDGTSSIYYTGYLGNAYLKGGRVNEAIQVLQEALEQTRNRVARFCEPELLRLLGEAYISEGRVDAGRDALRSAIELSRQQGARLFELRAALSFARLDRSADGAGALRRTLGSFGPTTEFPLLREGQTLLFESAT